MQDVGVRRLVLEEFHNGAVEENPAVGLIRVILAGVWIEINPVAPEKVVIADQEDLYRRTRQSCDMHIIGKRLGAERHAVSGRNGVRLKTEFFEIDRSVSRHT